MHEWELPHLKESHQVPNTGDVRADFWDVKFYPYIEPGVDPIFAAVGSTHILICRAPREKHIEILVSLIDEEPENENYACAWSKDLNDGTPLLCVGGDSGKIKIINALTGALRRVLSGHGGGINSLEISPTNPHILASGSEDCTVRIWSLDPAHEKQPCAAILAGDGHRETILSTAFHATGRYLLSSGIDRVVNLWVLPEFPDENTGTHKPTRIHYPHFSTSEVHSFIVDCVAFHNDLILSKAERESCIVLWSISGFSSTNPIPPPLSAPTAHDPDRDTRSAFTSSPLLYTRLVQFSIPDVDIMFMRFGLFPGLKEGSRGPVLAMCNQYSKVFFWDLSRLEEVWDYTSAENASSPTAQAQMAGLSFSSNSSGQENAGARKRPPFLIPFKSRVRGGKNPTFSRVRDASPADSDHSSVPQLDPSERARSDQEKSKEVWAKRYGIEDAGRELQSHKEEVIKGLSITGRQVAWSRGGECCVVVGSSGIIAVFERWEGLR